MIKPAPLPVRFAKVVWPTPGQALACLAISLIIIIATQFHQVLTFIGIGSVALEATNDAFHARFDGILKSQIASSSALITFWASVGLVAYLICWSAYNLLIEVRNEVMLETQYTNRGSHWRGPLGTLLLKVGGAALLFWSLTLIKPGFALWIALAAPAFFHPSLQDIALLVAAAMGMAAQIYFTFACVLVTFTPWYRSEAFTEHY